VLSGLRYSDQFHLVQAWLEVSIRLASGDPAAAVAFASDALERCDLPTSGPRYVWPLLMTSLEAVISAGAATADGGPGVLAERLHTLAEKTEAFGPVQEAWRLMFLAADPLADPAGLPGGARLRGWDAAAAGWETVRDPYLTATALACGAREALGALGTRATPGAGTAGTGTRPNADDRAAREDAATRLRRAARLAADLGAQPLSEQIAILARRAGISLVTSPGETDREQAGSGHAPGTAPLALTNREYEVLRLLTAGQSNREIAATLFISPKTASVHVSNILGKLGAASRTEAAARAHALRLFEESPR
jgi:DNA-binding CsgD family transcriptional regulator